MSEGMEKLFIGIAFAMLVIVLMWRKVIPSPVPLDANGNDASPAAMAVGVAYVSANVPLGYPPPLSMMALPTISTASPGQSLPVNGCDTCR